MTIVGDRAANAADQADIVRTLMRTTGTTRYFTGVDVPDHILFEAFDAARFAPQAGNRQPVRWIVVRDQETKAALGELYLPYWTATVQATLGPVPLESAPRWLRDADRFAHDFSSIPVLAVACAHISSLLITDANLDRVSVVGGGSIYPAVQNLCLALRSLGVGTAITTFLCAAEPQVRELLAIPDEFLTAAHVAVGYPAHRFPRTLTRQPAYSTTFAERFGNPLFGVDRRPDHAHGEVPAL